MLSQKMGEEGRGVSAALLPAVLSSLQGKQVGLPGQLTKRPLQLLQCKPSSFPIAILPSTSSSSLHHSMSWLPSPTGSGRMEAGLGHSSENLVVLGKEQFKASPEFSGHTHGSTIYHTLRWGGRTDLKVMTLPIL